MTDLVHSTVTETKEGLSEVGKVSRRPEKARRRSVRVANGRRKFVEGRRGSPVTGLSVTVVRAEETQSLILYGRESEREKVVRKGEEGARAIHGCYSANPVAAAGA